MLSRRPRVSGLTIRPVGPFDLGRISRLHKACFEDGWSRSDIAHLLSLPGSFGLICRSQDAAFPGIETMRGVGFALCRVARDESELLSIGVLPEHRRRNVAGKLLEAGMARCRAAGADVMFLEVALDNHPAQAVYARFGFERVGVRPDYYTRSDGTRMNAYTMRANLAGAVAAVG